MKLTYKLSTAEKSTRGALQNVTPLILENSDIEIFFYLSNARTLTSDYYVTFIDKLNQKHKLQIIDSKVMLPQKLYYEQVLTVQVDYVQCGKIIKTWYCNPLRIAFMDNLQKATLTIGADVYEVIERVASLEDELSGALERISTLESQSIDTFKTSILEQLTAIVNAHNLLAEDIAKIKQELSL